MHRITPLGAQIEGLRLWIEVGISTKGLGSGNGNCGVIPMLDVSRTSFAKRLAGHVALMIREGRTGTGHWIIPTMPATHSSHGELLIELLPATFPQRFT